MTSCMSKFEDYNTMRPDSALKHVLAKGADGPFPWQSLYDHTLAVMACANQLEALGYIVDKKFLYLLLEACRYHDMGKVNALFQERVQSKRRIFFNEQREVPHQLLSIFSIPQDEFTSLKDWYDVVYAVMHHHPFTYKHYYTDPAHKQLVYDTVKANGTYFKKLSTRIETKLMDQEPSTRRIILTGLLMKCDHAASGGYAVEYASNFLVDALQRQLEQWQRQQPQSNWNPLQVFCRDHSEENIIAIGETGMGKTEGALLWAGNHKTFFFLPVRTAINAIYDRVVSMLGRDNSEIHEQVSLLHSDALSYYANIFEDMKDLDIVDYYKRGKELSLPVTISTVDQIFDFVFHNPGYEMKLATLSYAHVIIDEIQMYDPKLLAYLIFGLQEIHRVGGKIAVMTATLPPFIRDFLCADDTIRFTEKAFTKQTKPRHNIKVKDAELNAADILALYQENEAQQRSNKILVICNTITKIQQLYRELSVLCPSLTEGKLHAFHARFIKADRQQKEKEIIRFGRTFDDQGNIDVNSGIWIVNQVCEASLDIDFDYEFTELQYLTSLFQRLGRVNRKGVKSIQEYNCFVYTRINEDLLQDRNNGRGFIDRTLYELSVEALQQIHGHITEAAKLNLLQTYFTTDRVRHSPYYTAYQTAYTAVKENAIFRSDELEKSRLTLRDITSFDVIPADVIEQEALYERYIELREQLRSKTLDAVQKVKIRDEISQWTVSIRGNLYWADIYGAEKRQAPGYEPLQVTPYLKIPVVSYSYSHEIGLCTVPELMPHDRTNNFL